MPANPQSSFENRPNRVLRKCNAEVDILQTLVLPCKRHSPGLGHFLLVRLSLVRITFLVVSQRKACTLRGALVFQSTQLSVINNHQSSTDCRKTEQKSIKVYPSARQVQLTSRSLGLQEFIRSKNSFFCVMRFEGSWPVNIMFHCDHPLCLLTVASWTTALP